MSLILSSNTKHIFKVKNITNINHFPNSVCILQRHLSYPRYRNTVRPKSFITITFPLFVNKAHLPWPVYPQRVGFLIAENKTTWDETLSVVDEIVCSVYKMCDVYKNSGCTSIISLLYCFFFWVLGIPNLNSILHNSVVCYFSSID